MLCAIARGASGVPTRLLNERKHRPSDDALLNNTGINNTANGALALSSNTTGNSNTATGAFALLSNTTGSGNAANGWQALFSNTTGADNTANGDSALLFNTTGNFNTAIGVVALLNNNGDNNIDIGHPGATAESGRIRIGTRGTHTATFIAGISGVAVTGSQVIVNSNGKLGVTASSERFKDAVKPMGKASEAILALKPVTFRYKHELDPEGSPEFGLVAEEVEKVNPDLVARDGERKAYSVRYEAVNAMLLNEFLKEHRKVEEHQHKIESLEKAVAQQQKENESIRSALQEQATQIQAVSAALQATKPSPRVVANDR
jgi:hypothetical protein